MKKYITGLVTGFILATTIGGSIALAYSPIELLIIPFGRNLGIATSTSFASLQIATTSANSTFRSQLVLTDNSGATTTKHLYMSYTKNGGFNIGTSSAATYATSSPRITITANGLVGISTSTPGTALDVNGDVTIEKAIPRVNTGANTAIACYTTGGQLGYITVTNLLGVTPACSAL